MTFYVFFDDQYLINYSTNHITAKLFRKIKSESYIHSLNYNHIVPSHKERVIVHYATSAMKRFLTSVSLQHEPKASDVITLVKKTFFARVSYEILYHEVWNKKI